MAEESRSSTNSIAVWLDSQPDQPEEYFFQPAANKRRACAHPDSKHRRKRHQLMETPGNAQLSKQTSDRKLRASDTRAPPMTLTSRGRAAKKPVRRPNAGSPVREARPNEDEDEEQTPKAPAPALNSIPPLLAQPLRPQMQASVNREASDSSESYGSKRTRSQSPIKSLMNLKDTNMPIVAKAWDSSEKPADLRGFVNDMEQIGDRVGCIPSAVKARFAAIGKTPRAFQIAEDSRQGGTEAEARATGGLGHEVFWYEVSKITRASNKCQVRAAPEPTWNSEVHSRVLQLALEGYWEGKEISYQDISMARLSNKSLVPWNVTTGAMQSKMVDYAIIIDPNEDFNGDAAKSIHNHIVEKVSGDMNASINQTSAPYVRYRPIGVSIETKRGLVGEEEAHVQLATWMIAQYTRLRQLMTNRAIGKLPSFPVLSVHGQRWFLMIACIQEKGTIHLIKELLVGDTGSFAGVYQVIAAIRRIAQWVNDDYRPWFEREFLGKANGVQASP